MKVATAAGLAFSVVLAWSAADVLVAAWSQGRASVSANFAAQVNNVNVANMAARAFHDPQQLQDIARQVEATRPRWETEQPKEAASGSWDDFAAFATAHGFAR